MYRLKLVIEDSEWYALQELARNQLRIPTEQAIWILRNELARHGLLPEDIKKQSSDSLYQNPTAG